MVGLAQRGSVHLQFAAICVGCSIGLRGNGRDGYDVRMVLTYMGGWLLCCVFFTLGVVVDSDELSRVS